MYGLLLSAHQKSRSRSGPLRITIKPRDKEIFHTVALFSFRFSAKIVLQKAAYLAEFITYHLRTVKYVTLVVLL